MPATDERGVDAAGAAGRLATSTRYELPTDLPSDEVLRRLRDHVSPEVTFGGVLWDRTDRDYVGTFGGNTFRIRIARRLPQFNAAYLFGRIEQRSAGSAVLIRFGTEMGYGQFLLTLLSAVALAAVGAVALLRPTVLQDLAIAATRRGRDIPVARQVGYDWARSRYYVGTVRLLGLLSLLMAAVLLTATLSARP